MQGCSSLQLLAEAEHEEHGLKEWLTVWMSKDTLTKFANGEEENQQT